MCWPRFSIARLSSSWWKREKKSRVSHVHVNESLSTSHLSMIPVSVAHELVAAARRMFAVYNAGHMLCRRLYVYKKAAAMEPALGIRRDAICDSVLLSANGLFSFRGSAKYRRSGRGHVNVYAYRRRACFDVQSIWQSACFDVENPRRSRFRVHPTHAFPSKCVSLPLIERTAPVGFRVRD